MYGLPPNLDLSFLEGSSLLQVCVGANEVILNFDQSISITIESAFRIHTVTGGDLVFEEPAAAAAELAKLLSGVIKKAVGESSGDLFLTFANGTCLQLTDSSEQYESYQIRRGTTEYIV